MKTRQWVFILCFLLSYLWFRPGIAAAQTGSESQLRIQVRHSDGTAVSGEPVTLERLPEEDPILPQCTTGVRGECTWSVGRGLYQVLFTRTLDDISALAVAEGGLRGFGLTVGDEPITYHFTFHDDGRVYFDAAPNAAVPEAVIPAGHLLHGGVAPTATPVPQPTESVTATATVPINRAVPNGGNGNPASGNRWRVILFIGGGLVLGGGFHLLRRRSGEARAHRKRPIRNPKSQIRNQEGSDA